MNNKDKDKNQASSDNLTSKDVTNLGKDIVKTTLVWTIAGALTDLVRKGIDIISRKGKS
jgi:hypothetical protein